jgi:hypothetical protein
MSSKRSIPVFIVTEMYVFKNVVCRIKKLVSLSFLLSLSALSHNIYIDSIRQRVVWVELFKI